jgi:AAA+ ATPase superfamily predicted ATPase
MESPFLYGVATSGKWFTDREEDTKRLSMNFTNGINTIIISPRRWGKTSLVLKVAGQLSKGDLRIVALDVFSCRSEDEFYRTFATAIIKQTSSKWEEWSENARQFLTALTPKISVGSDPMNDFSISFDLSNKRVLDEEVLNLPMKIAQKKGIRIVVCIDEFQQISEFTNAITFQKKLRSFWQLQAPYISYCLYGSKKHMMEKLFSKQSMPFYKFGDVIFLQKIVPEYWVPFIRQRFEETGKSISAELAEKICETVENHSSYVQQFAWLTWIHTKKQTTLADFNDAYKDLLNQNTSLYYSYMEGLTSLQINFLRAIADGIEDQFSRKETLIIYNLGTSANISRLKKSLEQKELIDITGKRVTFNDPVFRIWFKKEIL